MHKKIVQDCNKFPQNFSWSTHDDVLFTAAYTFSYTDNKCHNKHMNYFIYEAGEGLFSLYF